MNNDNSSKAVVDGLFKIYNKSKSQAPKKLRRSWDGEIRSAMRLIPNVKQPLKKELLKEHPELSYLFKK